jgi:diguanylate cyclase
LTPQAGWQRRQIAECPALNPPKDPNASAAAQAPRDLAAVWREVEQARAELARVRADVAAAQGQFGSIQAAQIVEANEQLVLSALRAQTDADTAAQALQAASRSAEFDALTELPNRVLLRDRLAQAVSSAKRHGGRLALLFVDLDNFKQINDMFGHAFGDQVLKLAASRLTSSVRAADTVSRHGGDEFLILLAEVALAGDAEAIADKLCAALGEPSRVGDHVVRLTASIGISLYPDDAEDADTLVELADAAMYRAKRHGAQSVVSQREGVVGEPSSGVTPFSHARAEPAQRHAQLQQANENLVLAALTAQELQASAEQAQARQMEVLAVVAHELRSPLGPIRNAAALLGLAGGRADEQLLHRMQGVIERQVGHVTRLVADLLDVSRARSGRFRLERQTVDMADLIEQAVEACRPALYARLQRLDVCLPACALLVHGDPVRLTQVLGNLLDNASKYTPVGGEIGVRVKAAARAIEITVSDNGIGITAEGLSKVFEPFAQDPHAVEFNRTGLGIGLTVVRELVDAHGGRVFASSAGSGLGSQFVVTLPLIAP